MAKQKVYTNKSGEEFVQKTLRLDPKLMKAVQLAVIKGDGNENDQDWIVTAIKERLERQSNA